LPGFDAAGFYHPPVKIALAQINPTIGDLPANAALIVDAIERARSAGAALVVLPELCVCGYPPKDLLTRRDFVQACAREVKRIGESATAGVTAVIGTPLPLEGGGVSNSLVVYRDNAFVDYYDKRLLPTYDVFDEDRYFTAGKRAVRVEVAGMQVGLAICEDLWHGEDAGFAGRYADRPDPVAATVEAGAQIIVAASASPFVVGKHLRHVDILRAHAMRHNLTMCSVNQVGGNDDLIFDGRACVVGADGAVEAQGSAFAADLLIHDVGRASGERGAPEQLGPEASIIEALTLGVRDYLGKTGFCNVIVGLSGGIDSALTAAIAVRALGSAHVLGVAMPGPFSSGHSVEDAQDLADRLGIRLVTVPIEDMHAGMRASIDPALETMGEGGLGTQLPDVADQNLQSRARGIVLMTLSNRTGALVLTTGNKSELAVGYCTLYGDMNGGLAVLSDVPKTMVFRVARWMNDHAVEVGFECSAIPERTITKAPSAELAPDQLDTDSLPPYEELDAIIELYVEGRQGAAAIVEQTGFDEALVRRIVRLIDVNEYKRRQLAIGLKVTTVAFGFGRRMPIARRWW
jgi:NAD+ synthase (glutamine-hydrolysing)